MILEEQYAQALHRARSSRKPHKELFKGLLQALTRRGHERLLPRIVAAYEKIELKEKRREHNLTTTKAAERTRLLLDLYKKMIQAK